MFNSSCPCIHAKIFSVHVLQVIRLPFVLEKPWGFCRLPNLQSFSFMFLYRGVADKWKYKAHIQWAFFIGMASCTVPLYSSPCTVACIVSAIRSGQIHNELSLKMKSDSVITVYSFAGQWWLDKSSVCLVNVWERKGKEDKCLVLTVLLV